MDSRYYRPASPRRTGNPARSSTSFDPYTESTYYGRPASPRSSADRISGVYPQHTYIPSSSSGSRSSNLKYDLYTGRPRRNTLTDSDDRHTRSNLNLPSITSIPIRSHGGHNHHELVSSPLARSFDNRPETYITHGTAPRREHKRIYSVDDDSRTTRLVAEQDVIESRRAGGYSVNSGGRTYHHHHKPLVKATEFGEDGYSYTDPASMYRDTEPAWRHPRSGSMERGSRPTSMIVDRAPRMSNRELGPPPTTRGLDKIKNGVHRNGSHHRGRSPSLERTRDSSKYDGYPEAVPSRSASTRHHHAPAIHQEPRESRRDTYHDSYDRRDRDAENRRYPSVDRFEDRDVASRGFGIASGNSSHVTDPPTDFQPAWTAPEAPRSRGNDYGSQYYVPEQADARMPEPRPAREREPVSTYDHSRDRDRDRRESGQNGSMSAAPIAAGAAVGAAATLGAAALKTRDRDRERDVDGEREPRKERDLEYRRDRNSDERRDERREREERLPPAAAAYASTQEPDRKARDRRYEDDDRERRPRKLSDDSGDERPRHYVDRDAAREADRRKEQAKEAPLDPDEEYRRRIQQEAERSGRGRDHDDSDREKERERRRRREEREKSRDRSVDARSRGASSTTGEPPQPRYDDRSSHVLDKSIVQEPDSIDKEPPSKAVTIVAPPKDPLPPVKGILRKPTEKFPEDPEPIREGVAPHKSAMKGKDIPPNARWTKIDRKLVNPQALAEAKERFEERLDCVIVLRVLTKAEIQKLADRTKEIREAREEEYDERDRDREYEHERRSRRSHRDEEDRRSRRDYDDEDTDDYGRDRERDRPRAIEAGR